MNNCVVCKKETKNKWYCSMECRDISRKEKSFIEIICKTCNKKFKTRKKHPKIFCSIKCSNSNIDKNKKMVESFKKTMVEKYGVNNPNKLKIVRDKIKKTNLERYGVESYSQTNEYAGKFKKTMNKKYGVEYAQQNEVIKQKTKKTVDERYGGFTLQVSKKRDKIGKKLIERYGVNNALKSNLIKDKVKKTNMEKYGTEWGLQNNDIRNKINKTVKIKYGVDNLSQNLTISNKIKKSMYITTYKRILTNYNKSVVPLFDEIEYNGGGYDKLYKFKCVKCGNEFVHCIYSGVIPRCEICHPKNCGSSIGENEILEFIKLLLPNDEILHKIRKILDNKLELDIYIPSKNLAIEFNGIVWHSERFGGKDKNYHLNKTKECEKKGIKLIHVFENEWMYKQDIVKSIIKSNLNIYSETVYARNCKIKEINTNEKNIFLEKNHLQGKDISSIRYGLYYEDELVSIMTFSKSRFNKNVEYEMTRFCNKINTKIIGGASKLFNHFVKNNNPKSVISYADKRFFNGELYDRLGFDFIEDTTTNYFYFNFKSPIELFSRQRFQKHKLQKLLPEYDKNISEWENMQINGYDRIFDCGNKKFIWNTK